MSARIIDGKQLSQTMRGEIAARVQVLADQHGVTPGLAAVLVGQDAASQVYVRNKRRACKKVGIESSLHQLDSQASQQELLELVAQLNEDPKVHGILVQLPLPGQIDEPAVTDAVSPCKDVDGLTPENLGLLAAGRPRFIPCTPHGVQQMLLRTAVKIEGTHVVIVGRSMLVGRPLAMLLSRKAAGGDATVTICHSRTRDIGAVTREADIVVVAIGRPEFLTADMVRPDATVIDVGINRADHGLVGDVDFESVRQVAGAISPVPGGVGPMTVTMLLYNTLGAAERSQ